MSSPVEALHPIIEDLEKDLADIERQRNAIEQKAHSLLSAINLLRSKAGMDPRPGLRAFNGHSQSESNGETIEPAPTQLRADTFFGKRMQTAARELLVMRKTAGGSAAKVRDIFEGLKAGGFQFETKDDHVAVISVRNMLTKRSETFQKLPNGTYGLKAWYPHAKQSKPLADDVQKPCSPEPRVDVPEPKQAPTSTTVAA